MPFVNLDRQVYRDDSPFVCATVAQARTVRGPSSTPANVYPQINPVTMMTLCGNAAFMDQAIRLYAWDSNSTAAESLPTVIAPLDPVTGSAIAIGRWRSP